MEDYQDVKYLQKSIDEYILKLEETHRMHRKIQFLLDVRGLLIINKINGDYVEFGVYRGEMMYSAAKILQQNIDRFIGFDTFTGLPKADNNDNESFVFKKKGFMASKKINSEKIMEGYNTILIEGDFREKTIIDKLRNTLQKISILSIDCNWPSSINVALKEAAPYLQNGSIIFFDDYFAGTGHRNVHDMLIKTLSNDMGITFIEFKTYPPSARAFLVEKKD